jgi:arylsulfatase
MTVLSEADLPARNTVEDPEAEGIKMAVYAAQIDRLDQNVGRLVSKLKNLEIYDNKVISNRANSIYVE